MDTHGGLITAHLAAWIEEHVDFPVVEAMELPEMPDRVAALTRTSGPGLVLEGAYDGLIYRIQVRGHPGDPSRPSYADAERCAWALDAVLLGAEMPTIGGVPTLGFSRSGAPPTPDEDAGNRPVLTCNYLVQAASVL